MLFRDNDSMGDVLTMKEGPVIWTTGVNHFPCLIVQKETSSKVSAPSGDKDGFILLLRCVSKPDTCLLSLLPGVPCKVKHVSPQQIICTTEPVGKGRRLGAPQPGTVFDNQRSKQAKHTWKHRVEIIWCEGDQETGFSKP